ncbi:hypothetical protein V8E53_003579 [Lactarius tabidus]
MAFVENCHYDLTHLLSSLAEESQATRPPGSPYPDVDAPTDLPSLSMGVFRDRDDMMGREPTDGMDQSQSDPDDDSDGDDNPIIPEEIMDPVDDPGSESDQMKDGGVPKNWDQMCCAKDTVDMNDGKGRAASGIEIWGYHPHPCGLINLLGDATEPLH